MNRDFMLFLRAGVYCCEDTRICTLPEFRFPVVWDRPKSEVTQLPMDIPTNASSGEPSEDTLRQQLDIQWRDHWQIRTQSWQALQIVALLLVAYIGSGLKMQDHAFLIAGWLTCMLASLFGMVVTVHHRKVQIRKFTYIWNFEKKLGLHHADLISNVSPPSPFSLRQIFNFRELANPTFMLFMHVGIFIMAAVYVVSRL